MQRRTTLALAGLLALPCLSRHAAAQGSTTGSGAAMTSADRLRTAALMGATFALQSSQMAADQAESAAVKQFAGFEIAEQQAIHQAQQVAGRPPLAVVPMEAAKAQQLEELRSLHGTEFDRAYLRAQLKGHEELRQVHEALATQAPDPAEKIISVMMLPMIRQHIVMLQAIQAGMRS